MFYFPGEKWYLHSQVQQWGILVTRHETEQGFSSVPAHLKHFITAVV